MWCGWPVSDVVRVPVRYPEADASVSRKTKIKLIQKKIEENTFVTSFFLRWIEMSRPDIFSLFQVSDLLE